MKDFINRIGQRHPVHVFHCTPMGKPRMTSRDRWKKRPVVERYHAFKDTLALQMQGFEMRKSGLHLYFLIPMPPSWSKKKRRDYHYFPHQQTPDIDNLVKAFLDAVMAEDKEVWDIRATKIWADQGGIIIMESTNQGENNE